MHCSFINWYRLLIYCNNAAMLGLFKYIRSVLVVRDVSEASVGGEDKESTVDVVMSS